MVTNVFKSLQNQCLCLKEETDYAETVFKAR